MLLRTGVECSLAATKIHGCVSPKGYNFPLSGEAHVIRGAEFDHIFKSIGFEAQSLRKNEHRQIPS